MKERIMSLEQQSPSFLARGSSFTEDSFFHGLGLETSFGMIQARCIYCALYLWNQIKLHNACSGSGLWNGKSEV